MHRFAALILALVFGFGTAAESALRVNQHRARTEVGDDTICIYVSHQMTEKRNRDSDPLNTRDPIVCKFVFDSKVVDPADDRVVRKVRRRAVQELGFERLSKICVFFSDVRRQGHRITSLENLLTMCTVKSSAGRVFREDLLPGDSLLQQ